MSVEEEEYRREKDATVVVTGAVIRVPRTKIWVAGTRSAGFIALTAGREVDNTGR